MITKPKTKALNEESFKQVDNILDNHDLYWKVEKEKLYTGSGIVTDQYATMRNDTILGYVKENYKVFQNWELIELAIRLAQSQDLKIHKAGFLGQGEKVYVQIDLGSNKMNYYDGRLTNDVVNRYITILNSHDGKGSLSFGCGNTVMSCSNQFTKFYKGASERIVHSMSLDDKLESAEKHFHNIIEDEYEMQCNFGEMNHRIVTNDVKLELIYKLTGVDLLNKDRASEHSTRKINQVESLVNAITTEIADKGNTLWGLFNGVTRYTTHDMYKDQEKSLKGSLTGIGNRYNTKAYEMLSDLVN